MPTLRWPRRRCKGCPVAGRSLLSYEKDLLAAEATYYELLRAHAPHVPAPRVLHVGSDDVLGDWLVMTCLPGRPLSLAGAQGDDRLVRRQVGAVVAQIQGIRGETFGYCGQRPHAVTWAVAFRQSSRPCWRMRPPGPSISGNCRPSSEVCSRAIAHCWTQSLSRVCCTSTCGRQRPRRRRSVLTTDGLAPALALPDVAVSVDGHRTSEPRERRRRLRVAHLPSRTAPQRVASLAALAPPADKPPILRPGLTR